MAYFIEFVGWLCKTNTIISACSTTKSIRKSRVEWVYASPVLERQSYPLPTSKIAGNFLIEIDVKISVGARNWIAFSLLWQFKQGDSTGHVPDLPTMESSITEGWRLFHCPNRSDLVCQGDGRHEVSNRATVKITSRFNWWLVLVWAKLILWSQRCDHNALLLYWQRINSRILNKDTGNDLHQLRDEVQGCCPLKIH